MPGLQPKQLIAAYNRGVITGHELRFRLIQAAVDFPPEEILPLVSEELLADIHRRAMDPPESPEKVLVVQSVCNTSDYDHEASLRQQQAAYYDGVWRWHRFLTAPRA